MAAAGSSVPAMNASSEQPTPPATPAPSALTSAGGRSPSAAASSAAASTAPAPSAGGGKALAPLAPLRSRSRKGRSDSPNGAASGSDSSRLSRIESSGAAAPCEEDSDAALDAVDGLSPEELLAEQQRSQATIVIDGRAFSSYVMSHVPAAFPIRLSSLMTRRLHRGKIDLVDIFAEEDKARFEQLYNMNGAVIVYDASTEKLENYDSKDPLHVILRALVLAGRTTKFLVGGFRAFCGAFAELAQETTEVVSSSKPCPFLSMSDLSHDLESPSPAPASAKGKFDGRFVSPMHTVRNILAIPPSEIFPFLYIGARKDAFDLELLKKLSITHIVNVTDDCENRFEKDTKIKYLRISVSDSWGQSLPEHFAKAFAFIDEAKQAGGRALIHCVAGISRSPTVTIAYVIQEKSCTLAEAYAYVKSKRPVISPNLDFMGELQVYEEQVRGVTSHLFQPKGESSTPKSPSTPTSQVLVN